MEKQAGHTFKNVEVFLKIASLAEKTLLLTRTSDKDRHPCRQRQSAHTCTVRAHS